MRTCRITPYIYIYIQFDSEDREGTEGLLMVFELFEVEATEEWWQDVKECGIVTKPWPQTCHSAEIFCFFRVSFMSP